MVAGYMQPLLFRRETRQGKHHAPADIRQSKIDLVGDICHGGDNELLEAVSCVGAF